MRRIIYLILIPLTLTACSCGRVAKKQEANQGNATNAIVEEDPVTDGEPAYFITMTDWEGVQCSQYQEADGYNRIQECVFPDASMRQVYDIAKKIDPNLKPDLPLHDRQYLSTKNGCIEVIYQYKTDQYLFIELIYQGGVTSIEIIEKESETLSRITYSAD